MTESRLEPMASELAMVLVQELLGTQKKREMSDADEATYQHALGNLLLYINSLERQSEGATANVVPGPTALVRDDSKVRPSSPPPTDLSGLSIEELVDRYGWQNRLRGQWGEVAEYVAECHATREEIGRRWMSR